MHRIDPRIVIIQIVLSGICAFWIFKPLAMLCEVLFLMSLFGLSSGEKQRLAVASIYAMDTDVIVLDEPTANLDGETIQNLRELLFTLKAEGKTLIISEHRLSWLGGIADRYVYMRKGRMVSHCALPSLCVKAFHLYRQQKSPFIACIAQKVCL